ncbi:gata transcription factor [Colletotrichum sojae]|uniref:Gata transcription factor n=1 Tax=Colletotrichum sojae TaxID=2175907 RepID=A0A8H6MU55_9PEZI|nr:gata transcription factor [Colletotrichum sojae]
MASPMPIAPMGNWGASSQPRPTPPPSAATADSEECGVQLKTMGLKVTYTFVDDGESFLARHPQLLQIQTVPLDEKRTIGMVDLKICAQAIARCSPELLNDATRDFAVYAYDYSEPDEPLVGQGLLGWIVNNVDDKRIIGRATRNPLSVFSNGVKDILEIKFKLKPVAAMVQPSYEHEPKADFHHTYQRSGNQMGAEMQPMRPADGPRPPASYAEWNNLMQSNPQMANPHPHHPPRVASPHQQPLQPQPTQHHNPYPQPIRRSNSFNYSAPPPPPPQQQQLVAIEPHPQPTQISEGPNRVAPTPVDTATETQVNPPSRPSSRASNRSRKSKPTGRPRGRPRKQPRTDSQGNTSGYEDGTDGDDGPAKKKRATTTQVTSNLNTPFGGGPESLRVAASTSGSLRTLRPMGMPTETPVGVHMQDVPRAPTPVPERGPSKPPAGKSAGSKLRRQSTLSQAATPPSQPQFSEPPFALSPSQQDGRSPVDSEAASPMYSEDSAGAIGSSPPVPRNTSFVRSSPPPSSPILPPMRMPMPQPDSGFMSGGIDDLFEDDASKQLPPKATRTTSLKSVTKERRSRSGIPIQVFQLSQQPSSEADLARNNNVQPPAPRPPTSTPSQEPTLPPLPVAGNDPRPMMAPPPPQPAGKESSPQPEEPVVALKSEVAETDAQGAPIPEYRETADLFDDSGLEQLAQAVRSMEDQPTTSVEIQPAKDVEPRAALPEPTTTPPHAEPPLALPPTTSALQLPTSLGTSITLPTVPASDPIGPLALPSLPLPDVTSFSEAPCPPSDALQPPKSPQAMSRQNKNYVKKQAIREKLLNAIANGQTPMYCSNCGAIETPTWRKIWTQEHKGVPEFTEFSDKPGKITAILVLDRDADEKPTRYQVIKKALAPKEERSPWQEHMLCNPCGIWLSKWKCHRPMDKWEKDGSRLSQQRRPRGAGRAPRPTRSKKAGASQTNPTSEAYLPTDPLGLEDRGISPMDDESRSRGVSQVSNTNESFEKLCQQPDQRGSRSQSPGNVSNPGSTHSRGSGTMKSPITLGTAEDDAPNMGSTRRLLFPSPRKEGAAKVLGELAVNVVQTATNSGPAESAQLMASAKEPSKDDVSQQPGGNKENLAIPDDDLESLFRSPAIPRPSTPPPRDRAAQSGPFKTPTRPTPSHRPITRSVTRSVSRSLRSGDLFRSPVGVRRTPTRTPRSAKGTVRRSPRLHHDEFAQMEMALEEYLKTQPVDPQYDADMLEAMNRALAESMSSTTNFDITGMVLDTNIQLEFGGLLGSPSRPSPRAQPQATDFDDWEA